MTSAQLPEVVALNSLMIDSARELFLPFFPQARQSWVEVAAKVAALYDYRSVSEDLLKKITNDMILWKLLSDKEFAAGDPQVEQKRIIVDVPKDLADLKKRIEEAHKNPGTDPAAEQLYGNVFLNKFRIVSPEEEKNPRLMFIMDGAPAEGSRDIITSSWGQLVRTRDKQIIQTAVDLFKYNIYTNGFAYGMYEFSHFAPMNVLLRTPDYVDALRRMLTSNWRNEVDTENFVNQYYMNHWGEGHLVQQIYANRLTAVGGPIMAGAEQILLAASNSKDVLDSISGMRYLVVSVPAGKKKQKPVQTLYRVESGSADAPIVLHKAAKLGGMTRRGQVTRQYNPAVDYHYVSVVTPGNDSSWGTLDDLDTREANALSMSGSDIVQLGGQDQQTRVTLEEAMENPILIMLPELKNANQRKAQETAAGVVRSDSQVQKLAKLTGNNAPQIITEQLVAHLKKQGINVYDRAAMAEFLKTHDIRSLQQMVTAYGKQKPYLNSKYKKLIPEIQSIIKVNRYDSSGTDVVTLKSEDQKIIYLIDHSADSELADNLRDGDGFGIRKAFNIENISKEDVREIIRNIAASYDYSPEGVLAALQAVGLTGEHLFGTDLDAELKRAADSDDVLYGKDREVRSQRGVGYYDGSGRESRGTERNLGQEGIETFTTPQGEVYGFVDKDGNIYLDETKISPEHPIHEYTHLWDRAVQKRNPELWKRGVELMKQSGLWDAVLNSRGRLQPLPSLTRCG